MDKVCPLTGNIKSGKNGFSSTNVAIEWGNEVKDVITKSVTAAIQQKYNKHALALTEMRTANENELQKILQALATLSKRVDRLAIREGNKVDGGDNKSVGCGNNGGRGSKASTTTSAAKMTTNKTMPTAATKIGYTQKAWSTIPCGPIIRGNGSSRERNLAEKKLRREDPVQRKKNKWARLEKDLATGKDDILRYVFLYFTSLMIFAWHPFAVRLFFL